MYVTPSLIYRDRSEFRDKTGLFVSKETAISTYCRWSIISFNSFFLLAAYFPRPVLFASIGFSNCHLVCVLVACEVIYLITLDPITTDNVLAYWVLLLSTFASLKHHCSSPKRSSTPIFNSRMATYLIMSSIFFSIPILRTTLIYYIL